MSDLEPRLSPFKLAPGAYQALAAVQKYASEAGIEPALRELVTIRASQINGCAFCLAMHVREARRAGESDDRLFLLDAWREAPVYSPRERAALAWAEAVTLVADGHVPDAVFAEASRHFSETELVNLTMTVIAINCWNRMMIAFRSQPQLGGN